jgi:hypothetical protein
LAKGFNLFKVRTEYAAGELVLLTHGASDPADDADLGV